MVNIILCDDEVESLQRTQDEIERIKTRLPYPVEVITYTDTDYLMERINNRELESDILIIDVDMPKMSGLDIAKYIRQNKLDIVIIFLTGHDEYVYSSFEFAPLRYIRKEFIKEELLYALIAVYRTAGIQIYFQIRNRFQSRLNLKIFHRIGCSRRTHTVIIQ